MADAVTISICIPAYKNPEFLRRLLDSIAIQTFRNFEVVVTDDSPGFEVNALCETYKGMFSLSYFHNLVPLGTPENWNEAVRKASGRWIKIMHDDDWFSDPDSLLAFAQEADENPNASFIFSAYRDVFLDENRERVMYVPSRRYKAFLRDPTVLFGRNIIGPPSVVLYQRSSPVLFDPAVKWVVDIDFYIRSVAAGRPAYIDKVLVNVGLGKMQVTQDCKRQREVEIPENFYLLQKVGNQHLKNVIVYDAWWRLMRNLEIRTAKDIPESGYPGPVPAVILSMVTWQRRIPALWLRIGPFSKMLMTLHYFLHRKSIPS